ncbi:hypothetical protein Bbelb_211010 [Branchiostoma belcheri]|nr:hypothetical protein Bbelb_211010 [Branchiostoma belcheri]
MNTQPAGRSRRSQAAEGRPPSQHRLQPALSPFVGKPATSSTFLLHGDSPAVLQIAPDRAQTSAQHPFPPSGPARTVRATMLMKEYRICMPLTVEEVSLPAFPSRLRDIRAVFSTRSPARSATEAPAFWLEVTGKMESTIYSCRQEVILHVISDDFRERTFPGQCF